MPKRKILFEDDEPEVNETINSSSSFRVNEKYANAYDKWRQKEELQKLKDRYGDVPMNETDSEESSSDDENPFEDLTPAEERDFLKKLAIVKSGDYKRYADEQGTSQNNDEEQSIPDIKSPMKKKRKEKQMFLKDYERKVILEKEGRLSDEDEDNDFFSSSNAIFGKQKTYVQEQKEIKESFKAALKKEDDNDEDFLKARKKTAQEEAKEEDEYLLWLKGQKDNVPDDKIVIALKPLRDYWSDSKLDEGERFLRDYILNKRYMEGEDEIAGGESLPTYGEIVGDEEVTLDDDEDELRRQEEFEHKYNFRYEEPDPEFIKTYPRTVAESLRRKEDKRKQKRDDYKKRKDEEKKKQIEEVKQLKNLKRREMMEKLQRLRKTAGIDELPVDEKELDDDFDPEEYDRMMQAAFGDDYYATNDDEKPLFSDDEEIDKPEEGDLANWDEWTRQSEADIEQGSIDADDGPGPSHKSGRATSSTKRTHARSLLAEALTKTKPTFDPADKKFEQYFDEYYKLDFEDIIGGDVRCRFKYRQVPANDFGLSVEEVLAAKDKELNSWVSVKKMSQYRTKDEELYDQKAYKNKARDASKKQRLLHSVFGEKSESEEHQDTNSANDQEPVDDSTAKKKRKKKKKKGNGQTVIDNEPVAAPTVSKEPVSNVKSKRNRKNMWKRKKNLIDRLSNERLMSYGVNAKKLKNRAKYARSE